jgi:flagellar motility protein MotE (MotC chaperone)
LADLDIEDDEDEKSVSATPAVGSAAVPGLGVTAATVDESKYNKYFKQMYPIGKKGADVTDYHDKYVADVRSELKQDESADPSDPRIPIVENALKYLYDGKLMMGATSEAAFAIAFPEVYARNPALYNAMVILAQYKAGEKPTVSLPLYEDYIASFSSSGAPAAATSPPVGPTPTSPATPSTPPAAARPVDNIALSLYTADGKVFDAFITNIDNYIEDVLKHSPKPKLTKKQKGDLMNLKKNIIPSVAAKKSVFETSYSTDNLKTLQENDPALYKEVMQLADLANDVKMTTGIDLTTLGAVTPSIKKKKTKKLADALVPSKPRSLTSPPKSIDFGTTEDYKTAALSLINKYADDSKVLENTIDNKIADLKKELQGFTGNAQQKENLQLLVKSYEVLKSIKFDTTIPRILWPDELRKQPEVVDALAFIHQNTPASDPVRGQLLEYDYSKTLDEYFKQLRSTVGDPITSKKIEGFQKFLKDKQGKIMLDEKKLYETAILTPSTPGSTGGVSVSTPMSQYRDLVNYIADNYASGDFPLLDVRDFKDLLKFVGENDDVIDFFHEAQVLKSLDGKDVSVLFKEYLTQNNITDFMELSQRKVAIGMTSADDLVEFFKKNIDKANGDKNKLPDATSRGFWNNESAKKAFKTLHEYLKGTTGLVKNEDQVRNGYDRFVSTFRLPSSGSVDRRKKYREIEYRLLSMRPLDQIPKGSNAIKEQQKYLKTLDDFLDMDEAERLSEIESLKNRLYPS